MLFPNDHDHDHYLISLDLLSDSVNFTVEVECEKKLPVLDILVRGIESNFEYSVYCIRKDTVFCTKKIPPIKMFSFTFSLLMI